MKCRATAQLRVGRELSGLARTISVLTGEVRKHSSTNKVRCDIVWGWQVGSIQLDVF